MSAQGTTTAGGEAQGRCWFRGNAPATDAELRGSCVSAWRRRKGRSALAVGVLLGAYTERSRSSGLLWLSCRCCSARAGRWPGTTSPFDRSNAQPFSGRFSGTVVATPAIRSAVIDALAPFGVEHLDIPFTAERVWQATKNAGKPVHR